MKIILPGGTGQVGHLLIRKLIRDGHTCVILSRNPEAASANCARHALTGAIRIVNWDGRTLGPWVTEIENADVVINLAGRSVNCRYTEANLKRMMSSRIESTRVVGLAIAAARTPPKLWLQSGTATIYAHRYDASNNEATGLIGGTEPGVPPLWKRSIDIALAWEEALAITPTPFTRKVVLRSAMVMSPDQGGVFSAFARLCSLGMGIHGTGNQFVSWIHEHDFTAALDFIIHDETLSGAINLCAPQPLPNREFIATLHRSLGTSVSIRVPRWLLEIGAFFQRTETELLLKSRRVTPGRLLDAGFHFQFHDWPSAADDLVRHWRR
ncbi:MAG: DUF1731 domain-containing protein [Verrucomicrobia bacterium]|nr:DUF1731 domain-containing protein [Verrucomicrobiota bacterium]